MLERLLREFVTSDGAPMDSSERRAPEETELDQNGILLRSIARLRRLDRRRRVLQAAVGGPNRGAGGVPAGAGVPSRAVGPAAQPARLLGAPRRPRHPAGYRTGASGVRVARPRGGRRPGASGWTKPLAERWTREAVRLKDAVLHRPGVRARRRARPHQAARPRRRVAGTDRAVARRGTVRRRSPGRPRGITRSIPTAPPPSRSRSGSCRGRLAAGASHARSDLESLWNQGWSMGGYGRYHQGSEPDAAGPWPFVIGLHRARVPRRGPARRGRGAWSSGCTRFRAPRPVRGSSCTAPACRRRTRRSESSPGRGPRSSSCSFVTSSACGRGSTPPVHPRRLGPRATSAAACR